ncbi:hypothetical protein SGUI_0897 [Serinicoccus hydrothermalis]|uniref:Uncharacterized protein n=1 Tax=Serinicoccus hydrothermalis TaxID=1758689 RepID=A0A1B1NA28_9MICO|nr:hypothetical protein SGUI_0897 [Serinicoccus hydrothermalis]
MEGGPGRGHTPFLSSGPARAAPRWNPGGRTDVVLGRPREETP